MNPKDMPLVTAVIPVYNHEQYVIECIRSLVNQTYLNIELIVINDGSKDGSHEQVLSLTEECKQRFVRYEYISRENIGVSATLNQALSTAMGKYYTALASDDIAFPRKVEFLVDALETKGPMYAAAFGNALFINGGGQEVHLMPNGTIHGIENENTYSTFLDFYTRNRNFDYRSELFGTYRTLLARNYLPAMSNIVRTMAIKEVGGWTNGNLVEDWEMWLKISKKYKFAYVDQSLAYYRLHGLNSCSTITHKLIHSSVALIAKEKAYCSQNCFMSDWENSFNCHLFALLKNKKSFLNRDICSLSLSEALSLISFLMKKSGKKALEKFCKETKIVAHEPVDTTKDHADELR
jgi:alpha-1,3-rhamnosyltransferase